MERMAQARRTSWSEKVRATDWLDNRTLFLAALILSILPIWIVPYLPFVDLPQHAGQVAGLREYWAGNELFTSRFEVNWFTPYLFGYLLLYLASSVLPMMIATKLILSLAIVAFPLVTGLLLKEIGGDERLRWLAIPASYSVALYWGFLSYLVALPFALLLVVLAIRYARKPTPATAAGVAMYSVFLFFCHVIALGFASLMALCYLAARYFRQPGKLVLLALPYAAPLPLIVIWQLRMQTQEAAVQNAPVIWGSIGEHMIMLFQQLAGLDGQPFVLNLALVAIFIVLPLLLGAKPSHRPERWLLLAVGTAVYFLFPSFAQNTALLYQRLAVFLVPLWLLLWDPPRQSPRFLGLIVVGAVLVWSAAMTARFSGFSRETASFDSIISRIEPGRSIAYMPICNSTPRFVNPVYLHFGAWYQALSAGVVDMNAAVFHPQMLRFRDMNAPRIGEQLAWDPLAFEWNANGGANYDYFVVCSAPRVDASPGIFKEHASSVELIAEAGPWHLYRNLDK